MIHAALSLSLMRRSCIFLFCLPLIVFVTVWHFFFARMRESYCTWPVSF